MLPIGFVLLSIGVLLLIWAVKKKKSVLKEMYKRYEDAFYALSEVFFDNHEKIYKNEQAKNIVFYHTNSFLASFEKNISYHIYGKYQPGIYEDIRFLC